MAAFVLLKIKQRITTPGILKSMRYNYHFQKVYSLLPKKYFETLLDLIVARTITFYWKDNKQSRLLNFL